MTEMNRKNRTRRPTTRRVANALVARLVAMFVALAIVGGALGAQEAAMSESEALATLFRDGPEALDYTEQVRAAIGMDQLQAIVDQIEAQLGGFNEVDGDSNPYTLQFQNGTATANMFLDGDGRVAGLQFTSVVPATANLDEAVSGFLELAGTTSITILRDGEVVRSEGGGEALAIGSSFKLAVLKALEDAIEAGRSSWDTVLTLREEDVSLPTGVLQEWPIGSRITVEAAAILMISRSDNTATDLLMRHVGREAIEEYAPNSRPFLTTREAFLLKAEEQAAERERFLSGSLAAKRRVLRSLDGELPPASLFTGDPVHPEIEWFFTTQELARLILSIDRLDILGVNPGVADARAWEQVGYKGGSEPGVLNMTLRLVAADGTEYALSATQTRDEAVDTNAFVSALQSVLVHLR